MFQSIKQFFENNFSNEKQNQMSMEERLNLAAATLLIEISYSDMEISDEECQILKDVLVKRFSVSPEIVNQLIKLASEQVKDLNSSYEFTRLINNYFDKEEKYQLVRAMWEIAFADNELDCYEEAMIRKLADLLYVPHSDFIRAKLSVIEKI